MQVFCQWRPVPGQKSTYTRPLGHLETAFAWDSIHWGIADSCQHFVVSTVSSSDSDTLFSEANIHRAWCALKRQYPLISADLIERKDFSGFDFTVHEDRINSVHPKEIAFMSASSDEEAVEMLQSSTNSKPTLSHDLLGMLWLISVPSRTTNSKTWHVALHMRHCIMDGMTIYAQATAFFDILTSKQVPSRYVPKVSFEDYLNLHACVDDLNPSRHNVARLRWRRAIAAAMENRFNKVTNGGHTLPQTNVVYTPKTPLVTRSLNYRCTKDISKQILMACRQAGITLGHVMPVLALLAHARIALRLRDEGLIPDAEWEKKIREPSHFVGPLNLRPYLDADWYNSGGATRGCCAISFYNITLPSIPVAHTSGPSVKEYFSFNDLLSKKKFLSMCKLVKKQSDKFLNHPLLVEFAELRGENFALRTKSVAMRWRAASDGSSSVLPPETTRPYIFCNGCSTVGNVSSMLPSVYPLNHDKDSKVQETKSPRLLINDVYSYLRCRPRELYLTSITYGGVLQFVVFLDTTCYDLAMAQDWLNHVGQAAEWYLGSNQGSDLQGSVQAAKL